MFASPVFAKICSFPFGVADLAMFRIARLFGFDHAMAQLCWSFRGMSSTVSRREVEIGPDRAMSISTRYVIAGPLQICLTSARLRG